MQHSLPLAVVLPPREAFAAGAAGAIALLVRRLNRGETGCFAPVVFGPPPPLPPFPDVPFRPVALPWWYPGSPGVRQAVALLPWFQREKPALIEVHNRPDTALFLARRTSVPVSLLLHNDPQDMAATQRPRARARLLESLAGVAVVSNFLRSRFLEGLRAGSEHLAIVPNCIDFAELAEPLPMPARERVILFVGRVVADKGADVFVSACARVLPRLAGWRAEMIGGDRFGPETKETPFLRSLRASAEAAGVRLAGYRPHEDVLAAMARVAIVVVPSRWPEPFGLTALEAMASGAAVIASEAGALPEVTGHAALLVRPGDAEALAAAIEALATDESRRTALAEAGRAQARAFDLKAGQSALHAWRAGLVSKCAADVA
ncbi:MAG: glycosyltransferase family 4 protein [Acidobacteriia bacterium]|nr:glycosyltransferase family 4 protein [Methyloceanibacter sp.]MBX5473140.1 glycosyltransferase family 4 protein [Acetobacteraceae bacterium]MCL6492313.1 glycosyltransferase family 4 protein [Terriglobia bacterium]